MNLGELKKLPNLLTLARIIMVPLLWFLAITQRKVVFVVIYFIAVITDYFDGYAARKLGQHSMFGARFDSAADNIFIFSLPFWVWFLLPEFVMQHLIMILVLVGLNLCSIMYAYLKFKQLVSYHLYSMKISAVILHLFILYTLLIGINNVLFYITAGIMIIALVEELLVTVINNKHTINKHSIFSK